MKDKILNYINSFDNRYHTISIVCVFGILAIIFTFLLCHKTKDGFYETDWRGIPLAFFLTLILDLFFGIGRNSPMDVSKETVKPTVLIEKDPVDDDPAKL